MDEGHDQPQNRRARRAAAKASGKPIAEPTTAPRLKLAQPDYSRPKEKTLLDLYNDNKELIVKGQPFNNDRHADGLVRDENGDVLQRKMRDDEAVGPVADAFFWAVSLAMLHLTLDVLAQNQYRHEIDVQALLWRTATVLPVLWLLLYLLRSSSARRWRLSRQTFFFIVAIATGCYTIRVANRFSYYAVMKQAPPLGTLWIYSVIEMDLPFALVSLLVNGAYLWYNSFSIY